MMYSHGFNASGDLEAYEHPAIFPEELVYRHIYTWTNCGDIVLDYFMGSGTTAKIARNLGRKYIGCDLSPEYVALAQTRLQNTDPFQHTMLPNGMKQLSLFEAVS
jgi:site-specific DNA-methyltransferase (adenine-specific)